MIGEKKTNGYVEGEEDREKERERQRREDGEIGSQSEQITEHVSKQLSHSQHQQLQ